MQNGTDGIGCVHVSLDWEMSAVCALMDIFCNLSHATNAHSGVRFFSQEQLVVRSVKLEVDSYPLSKAWHVAPFSNPPPTRSCSTIRCQNASTNRRQLLGHGDGDGDGDGDYA
jgi:hypothetical protein